MECSDFLLSSWTQNSMSRCFSPMKPPCFFSGENPILSCSQHRHKINFKKSLYNICLYYLKPFDWDINLYYKIWKRKGEGKGKGVVREGIGRRKGREGKRAVRTIMIHFWNFCSKKIISQSFIPPAEVWAIGWLGMALCFAWEHFDCPVFW